MLKAVIFDFDGLIIDTEETEYRAWQEVYERYGLDLPLETYVLCVGRGATTQVFHPYTYLEEQLGRSLDREEHMEVVRQRNLALIARQPLLPGVKEQLEQARERGLRLAVASSSPRRWVAGHLSRLGLLEAFETLACGDEVEHTKPFPDPYLKALEKLGVAASEAVALEDSLNGMLAARAAGLFCVVVPSALTRSLPFGEVDLHLTSLSELDLSRLSQRFGKVEDDLRS